MRRQAWEEAIANIDIGAGTRLSNIIARKVLKALEDAEPDHYVTFAEDGWVIEHSLSCRLDGTMGSCAYHKALTEVVDDPDLEEFGRWKITGIDSEGLPSLERAE